MHPSKRSSPEAPTWVHSDDPSRRLRLQRGRALLLACPSHPLHTRRLPTTGSSSQHPSTKPSPAFAAICRFRGRSPMVPRDFRNHHTFTMYRHTRPTTVCRPSQMSSQSRFTPRGITTALATHRIPTTSLPCHHRALLLLTLYHRHLHRDRVNTSPLRRQCSHCLAAVRTSYLVLSTMVATSLLHHHPPCPRTANQRMLLTPMFSVAAAQEGVAVMSMSGTMAPLLSVVKHPASDRLARVVTRQRHNRRKRKSLLVCVQEPGICSIRNIWFRRNSNLQLRLMSVSGRSLE